MTNEQQSESDVARVEQAARALGEFFETVQIFVTRHDPAERDGTVRFSSGIGNWYARAGQVGEWMVMQEERTRVHTRKLEGETPTDDSNNES